jgi:hypothetical protein
MSAIGVPAAMLVPKESWSTQDCPEAEYNLQASQNAQYMNGSRLGESRNSHHSIRDSNFLRHLPERRGSKPRARSSFLRHPPERSASIIFRRNVR